MHFVRSFVALALLLVPAVASAAPPAPSHLRAKPRRTARVQKPEPKTCLKAAVEKAGGTLTLTKKVAAPAEA